MQKYNLDKLIKISVCSERISNRFFKLEYKPKGFFWWQKEQLSGFYDGHDYNQAYIGEKLPETYMHRDDKIFLKPCVIMYFPDDHTLVKYFDTYADAQKYADVIAPTKNWLIE